MSYLIILNQVLSSDDLDKNYREKAKQYCTDFYSERGVEENSIIDYIGNGAQSILYKCENSNGVPEQTALKIYFKSDDKNFTELEMIDRQLTDQNVRYPVYNWVDGIGLGSDNIHCIRHNYARLLNVFHENRFLELWVTMSFFKNTWSG